MYDEVIRNLHNESNYALPSQTRKALIEAAEVIEKLEIIIAGLNEVIKGLADDTLCWIPVTERLPPSEKEVYVTDGEYIARANLLDEVFPGDKPCWSYSGLGEITHWCEQIPLPQPPKEES